MAERDLVVKFIGDEKDLLRAFKKSEAGAAAFESRFTTLNKSLRGGLAGSGIGARSSLLFGSGAFIGTASVTAGLKKSIDSASDLNEQIDRTRVLLGDASDGVISWSETTAKSMGISQRAALAAAGTFTGLFQVVGASPAKAAALSQTLVKLAADLASLQNTSPEDALIALRSGLVGESEPLRRYNVFLSEARVQQVAFADTGKKSAAALTNQEKAMARYEIIMKDTISAQGNFAQTSDGLANQTRILRAETDDLAAEFGQTLIPALEATVTSLNKTLIGTQDLIGGLRNLRNRIGDSHFADGFNEGVEKASSGLSDFFLNIRDGIPLLERLRGAVKGAIEPTTATPAPLQRLRSPDAADAALNAVKDLAKSSKAVDTAKKLFDAHLKGLGLKLDKAEISEGLDDDLRVLRETETSIEKRIKAEGKTFALVEKLTKVRQQIARIEGQKAEQASQDASDAFEGVLDALNLKLDIAKTTRGFNDDLAALRSIQDVIQQRIKAEGQTTDLMRQLFENRQAQAETLRNQRAAQQFDILGLTSEGGKRTPGSGSLLKRARSLQDQVKGTSLDTSKTRSQLQNIVRVLSGAFGKAGKDVRDAILEMLNNISDALEGKGTKKGKGPLTKTSGLNTKRILEGLGLSPQQERELRDRLAHFNTAGIKLAGAPAGTRTTGGFTGGTGFVIENNVTVEIDGKKLTTTVTREQQKTRRRNPLQQRGPNRHK